MYALKIPKSPERSQPLGIERKLGKILKNERGEKGLY